MHRKKQEPFRATLLTIMYVLRDKYNSSSLTKHI